MKETVFTVYCGKKGLKEHFLQCTAQKNVENDIFYSALPEERLKANRRHATCALQAVLILANTNKYANCNAVQIVSFATLQN